VRDELRVFFNFESGSGLTTYGVFDGVYTGPLVVLCVFLFQFKVVGPRSSLEVGPSQRCDN
jgi:hypothetical protein